jgi:hypothetical protein
MAEIKNKERIMTMWLSSGESCSSVSIVTSYAVDGRGSISGRHKRLFSKHSVQTGSEGHQTSYTMGNGGSFPGNNAAEA